MTTAVSTMGKEENKYLKLRGNIWWYQRRIPMALLEHFSGDKFISQSLHTGDIREARAKRNILNGKLEEHKFNSSNPTRHRFLELLQEFQFAKEGDSKDWNLHYDPDAWDRKGDKVAVDAFTTVSGTKDQSHKYGMTLRESVAVWTRKFKDTKTKDTVDKIKKAAEEFLKFLNTYDIQLEDISKRHVHDYIEVLQVNYAKTTTQGKISRLRSIWAYCDSLGEVSGACPFDGHSYSGSNEVSKKQPFTVEEMQWIKNNVAIDEEGRRLLVELGVFTGCRISELCNFRVEHVINRDGVVAIFIEKGKTSSATRLVPITDELGECLLEFCQNKEPQELALGLDGKESSRWFSKVKSEYVSKDSAKCFHSFRVMFSTALQQAEVDELKAAALLGHKRGNTMTYGYYSKGYELKQLKEAYEKCIDKIIW